MKVLIASDIHGNLEYTQKLDDLCNKESFDKIVLLGDILNNYYYYDPKEIDEIIKILNKRASITIAVRGNCDRSYDGDRLNFSLTNEIDKIDLDNHSFFITHGHLYNKYHSYLDNNPTISGHTHIYNLQGIHLNPGSVGFPRMNKEHTCFIYQDNCIYLIDIDTQKKIEYKLL